MSITDELRAWNTGRLRPDHAGALDAIADRIDAKHKAKADEAYENGKRDERADWLDETDGGYIKLPVDADGVLIHVGDELDGLRYEDGTVTGIQYGTDGRTMIAVRPNGWDTSTWRDPEEYRHHAADSWERIIEDAQEYVTDDEPLYSVSELVERCRRLAGEA